MTATDPMTVPHILGLCAEIDEGRDELLPVLADTLDDLGDPRAEGLRLIEEQEPDEIHPDYQPGWLWLSKPGCPTGLPASVFERLRGDDETRRNDTERIYPSRHAAILALAQALTPTAASS
jgi:hypothetical protein